MHVVEAGHAFDYSFASHDTQLKQLLLDKRLCRHRAMNGDARGKPAHDHDDSTLPYSTEVLRSYFFGSAALSRRSILASARSLATRSTCALRDANCSISPRT